MAQRLDEGPFVVDQLVQGSFGSRSARATFRTIISPPRSAIHNQDGGPVLIWGNGQVTPGRPARSVIVTIFGFIFVEADAGGLPGGPQTAVRVVGIIVALGLLAANNRLRKAAASAGHPVSLSARSSQLGPRYWMVVAAEVVALAGGFVVINEVIGAHALNVPWIAFVVGVHFFWLAPLWNRRVYYVVLGAAVAVLGLAGFALYAAGASALTLRVVSGIGSGVVLYLAAANSLRRPAATPDVPSALVD
jgi:hypothetical protein